MKTPCSEPEEVSFPVEDGGQVFADVYGDGDRCVVLAHGARFDKASWKEQANQLAGAGFRVVAIDFRGYGKSRGGSASETPQDEMHLDVLAALRYLRQQGAASVSVIGGSMGGRAAANAVVNGSPGAIDRLILLAHAPIEHPGLISGPKLFATAEGDPVTRHVLDQYDKAPEPKELLILEGSAHAQFLFTTEQNERLMKEILRFLSASPAGQDQ